MISIEKPQKSKKKKIFEISKNYEFHKYKRAFVFCGKKEMEEEGVWGFVSLSLLIWEVCGGNFSKFLAAVVSENF